RPGRRTEEGDETVRPHLGYPSVRSRCLGAVRRPGRRRDHRGQNRDYQRVVPGKTGRTGPPRGAALMPKKVTPEQRDAVLRLLAQGQDRDTIATAVGVTPGQVSAISAHVKMGTYSLPEPDDPPEAVEHAEAPVQLERTTNLLRQLQQLEGAKGHEAQINPILLGVDVETSEEVYYNPDP